MRVSKKTRALGWGLSLGTRHRLQYTCAYIDTITCTCTHTPAHTDTDMDAHTHVRARKASHHTFAFLATLPWLSSRDC